jgi:hypothetical protein
MSNNTGGPAFPVEYYDAQLDKRRVMQGMTLRDYFAAKAMQGMMVDVEQPRCDYIAKQAYAIADAMMEARNAAQ